MNSYLISFFFLSVAIVSLVSRRDQDKRIKEITVKESLVYIRIYFFRLMDYRCFFRESLLFEVGRDLQRVGPSVETIVSIRPSIEHNPNDSARHTNTTLSISNSEPNGPGEENRMRRGEKNHLKKLKTTSVCPALLS